MKRTNLLRFDSIQGQMSLLFLAFTALVMVSASVTFWSLETQKQDALLVNLAGRQRMLVQQMSREALQMSMDEGEPHAQLLRGSMQTFEQTLAALRLGGQAPYLPGQAALLPPARHPSVRAQLDQVQASWQGFQVDLETILSQPPASAEFNRALQDVQAAYPELAAQSDVAVRLYEQVASQKVVRLRWIQAIFLGCALALLAVGAYMVRKSVIRPIRELGVAAKRIGGSELDAPVIVEGPQEVQSLSGAFEDMRLQLQASQSEAQAWTGILEQRVAQRTQELEALNAVSREISSRLAIQEVLGSITQKTQELMGGEVVFLCLLDEQGQSINLHAAYGPPSSICKHSSPLDSPTVERVLAGDQALRCDEQGCYGYCEIMAASYRTSHLAAPLRLGRQVIGALCVGDSHPDRFPKDAAEMLTKLANVAAVALQNARLYEQAERAAALEERQCIAAEMHDGLAQTLSYSKMAVDQALLHLEAGQTASAAGILERVDKALDQAIDDTRSAIQSLQEQGPLTLTLQEQLFELAGEFSRQGLPVDWRSMVQTPVILPNQQAAHILRLAREALLNAQRHSQATRFSLRLEQQNSELVLWAEDDGVGFDPRALSPGDGRGHFGLSIMQARAARIGGRLEIHSAPGSGTRVGLFWPAQEADA